MRSHSLCTIAVLLGVSGLAACSGKSNDLFKEPQPEPGAGSGGDGAGAGEGGSVSEAGSGGTTPSGGTGGTPPSGGSSGAAGALADGGLDAPADSSTCGSDPNEDVDGDGYTPNEGDCNDCDPGINPGAFDDGVGNVDKNCDGAPGGDSTECDAAFAIDDEDPMHAANAIGLCRAAVANAVGKDKKWGVLAARYVLADGTLANQFPNSQVVGGFNPYSHGIAAQFGAANVQQGKTMLVLSSGTARAPDQPNYYPPGGDQVGQTGGGLMQTACAYPIPNMVSPACPGVIPGTPFDAIALEVDLRVPTNARSLKFTFNFYTFEFPVYICSEYNDFYITLMSPKPADSSDGNLVFDDQHNPISANTGLLRACPTQTADGGHSYPCPLGVALLANTGFDDTNLTGPHAATGWLETSTPVQPGSLITLRFAIWDSADEVLDSTVLIDKLTFSGDPVMQTSTKPVDNPK